ncbi:VOC family protein [Frigidibacter mobilis]|uniref:Glyoxalase/bleomycin resistance protein/dioxygenase n=1 Tax=Frigidibacter mobilis TaxID=1335048 RepID=A0A159Z4U1_9RHOB|nr:VOC family protein [Frigidibacter mobilis]AMY69350.1 glyoxalase/bleomycin resistance protein/dioxygenase [Frigidibacter mobilis]
MTAPALLALHHVQLAMPAGGEAQARAFYGALLGLTEVPKPAPLQGRGGLWFERGSLRLHLGVEAPFTPARKAHPAFAVQGLAALADRLQEAGHPTRAEIDLPGMDRLYVDDPFGNRLELLEITG